MIDPQVIVAALGAVITAAAVIVAADRARVWLKPTGTHRATPSMAPLAAAIATGDAESAGNDWCPECKGRGVHSFHTDGTRTCWANGHHTEED